MSEVLYSDINSLTSCLPNLTGQSYCRKRRSEQVKDRIKNFIIRNYLFDQYKGLIAKR
jgi:hypothetical protein